MKNIGMLLLLVGVALSASFGARLSPKMHESLVVEGKAKMASTLETQAKAAFCEARSTPVAEDGCKGDEAPKADAPKDKAPEDATAKPAPTFESLAREGNAAVAALRERQGLTDKDRKLHAAWVKAAEAAVEPAARAKMLKPVAPTDRVHGWFSLAGLMFLLGLALVAVGALIARKAVRAEALAEQPDTKGGGARDFGVMLGELDDGIAAMVQKMAAVDMATPADLNAIKVEIENIQAEIIEPLIATRTRVQVRLGMAGFAEVFGPLSAAERRINRAWSALVDQHWPEAFASVQRAQTDMAACREVFTRLSA